MIEYLTDIQRAMLVRFLQDEENKRTRRQSAAFNELDTDLARTRARRDPAAEARDPRKETS